LLTRVSRPRRREINLNSAKRDVSELLVLNYQEAAERYRQRLLPFSSD
jgi:hypothetical protein